MFLKGQQHTILSLNVLKGTTAHHSLTDLKGTTAHHSLTVLKGTTAHHSLTVLKGTTALHSLFLKGQQHTILSLFLKGQQHTILSLILKGQQHTILSLFLKGQQHSIFSLKVLKVSVVSILLVTTRLPSCILVTRLSLRLPWTSFGPVPSFCQNTGGDVNQVETHWLCTCILRSVVWAWSYSSYLLSVWCKNILTGGGSWWDCTILWHGGLNVLRWTKFETETIGSTK